MSEITYDRPKVGVDIFVVRDDTLLLGKRARGFGKGTWALPGGRPEKGEDFGVAGKRELKEETGLHTEKLQLLNVINDTAAGEHYVHFNFLVLAFSGEPHRTEPDTFEEWRWFPLHALPTELFPGHVVSIRAYVSNHTDGRFVDANEAAHL